MNLFESDYIKSLMLAAFYVTLIVSAITTVWEVYFKADHRRKLLVVAASLLISVLLADFSQEFIIEWQETVTDLLITLSFSILFYSYLGAKYISALFLKVKKLLPGTNNE